MSGFSVTPTVSKRISASKCERNLATDSENLAEKKLSPEKKGNAVVFPPAYAAAVEGAKEQAVLEGSGRGTSIETSLSVAAGTSSAIGSREAVGNAARQHERSGLGANAGRTDSRRIEQVAESTGVPLASGSYGTSVAVKKAEQLARDQGAQGSDLENVKSSIAAVAGEMSSAVRGAVTEKKRVKVENLA